MTVAGLTLLDVLLVEDNQADVLLAEEAVALSRQPVRLRFARDGRHALEILQMPGSVPPHLLLDVNMPRMTGLELLGHLKRRVPVVMVTTSRAQEDIDRAYDLGRTPSSPKPWRCQNSWT